VKKIDQIFIIIIIIIINAIAVVVIIIIIVVVVVIIEVASLLPWLNDFQWYMRTIRRTQVALT
jgi:hypothetical protein